VQESWLGSASEGRPAERTCPPPGLKRDRDRRTSSTGETCLVHAHAKSRLTSETSADTPGGNHGHGRACADRTRAILCSVRAGLHIRKICGTMLADGGAIN
jgi:hypothetical protein